MPRMTQMRGTGRGAGGSEKHGPGGQGAGPLLPALLQPAAVTAWGGPLLRPGLGSLLGTMGMVVAAH